MTANRYRTDLALKASGRAARAMLAAARAHDRVLMVAQNRRWIPAVRAMRRAVSEGCLGPLATVNVDFYIGAHFGGFRTEMEHPLILDMAVHHFDLIRAITGLEPQRVYCKAYNPKGSWYRHGAACTAVFECQQDCLITYRGSWCAEGRQTGWAGDWDLVGPKGSINWRQEKQPAVTRPASKEAFIREQHTTPLGVTPNADDDEAVMLQHFLEALEKGTTPDTAGADNIKSMAMVFGAIESDRVGKPLVLRES